MQTRQRTSFWNQPLDFVMVFCRNHQGSRKVHVMVNVRSSRAAWLEEDWCQLCMIGQDKPSILLINDYRSWPGLYGLNLYTFANKPSDVCLIKIYKKMHYHQRKYLSFKIICVARYHIAKKRLFNFNLNDLYLFISNS